MYKRFAEVKYDRVGEGGKGLDMNGLNFQAKAFGFSLKVSLNPLKDFWTTKIYTILYVAKFPDDLKGFAHEEVMGKGFNIKVKVLLIFFLLELLA